jgi:hypothetical protein
VSPENILEFKRENQILYAAEASAKTGKNVERLFTDCAGFLYNKYHDKLGEIGHDGDLSSDNDSFAQNNSFDSQGRRSGSFLESRGHKAGKLGGRRRSKRRKKCQC